MPGQSIRRRSTICGTFLACTLVGAMTLPASARAQPGSPPALSAGNTKFSYADLADLALSAPIVVGVTVVRAERLRGELAPGLVPGKARFLIEAETGMLLRGVDGLPGSISYIVDVPLDAKGRAPKLKKARFILIADRVAGRAQEVRLTSPYSQLDWTPSTESQLRTLLTEASAASAAPPVTGIGNAFHVPGAIPGESETQIFLTTSNNRPISLSVLRRPGEQPQWSVALSEMIDESARAPAPATLLWYRLACFLPARMSGRSIASLSENEAWAIRRDYQYVLQQLGPCGRTIPR